jgi:hypothetical protein
MADDHDRLLHAFREAYTRLTKTGASKSSQGVESAYGEAYQALVRAGLRPQIKKKYR